MTEKVEERITELEQLIKGRWKAKGHELYLRFELPPMTRGWGTLLASDSDGFANAAMLDYEIEILEGKECLVTTTKDSIKYRYKFSLDTDSLFIEFRPNLFETKVQEYQRLK